MLGAPQAEENPLDDLDYGRKEAWNDETQSKFLNRRMR